MGLRFRKTIKIANGLNLNISGSGISFSAKKGGATFTTGSNGTYVGYGAKGTGLSYRKKISGKGVTGALGDMIKGKKKTTGSNKLTTFGDIDIDIDGNGNLIIFEDGDVVEDEKRKKKILLLPDMKKKAEEMKEEYARAFLREYVKMSAKMLHVHKRAVNVTSKDVYPSDYPSISTGLIEEPVFDEECPTVETIKEELEAEAEIKIKRSIFVNEKKKRAAYVNDNLEKVYQQRLTEWEEKKTAFEDDRPKLLFDLKNEVDEKVIKNSIEGKEDAINEIMDKWLSSLVFDFETSINYEYEEITGTIYADLDLPEIEDISSTEMVKTEKGDIKEKQKTQVTIKNEYNIWVHSIMIFFAAGIFNVSPQINEVIMSGRTQRRDSSGDLNDTYICTVDFKRDIFEETDLKAVNSIDFYHRFENREILSSAGMLKSIQPYYKKESS